MSLISKGLGRQLLTLAGLALLALGISALAPPPPAPATDEHAAPAAFWSISETTPAVVLASAPPTEGSPAPTAAEALDLQGEIPSAPTPPPTSPPPEPAQPAGDAKIPQPESLPAAEERMQLRELTAAELHQRLETALGARLPLMADDGDQWLRFSVDGSDGAPVLVAAHRETGEVRLVARPDQLKAWRQIIGAMDVPAAGDRTTHLFTAPKAVAPHIKQAVGALVAQAPAQAAEGADQRPAPADAAAEDAEALLGPVQIETIEGTDFFVIRGDPRDVRRVLEIVRQLEAMNRVSEPRVVVHELQHVNSLSIAQLLETMFGPADENTFSLAPFYGPLLPLPLGRPNAVLLIGGPTTVEKAQDLLRQLDVAGEAMTQFEVFRLKNAAAEQVRTVVERMFAIEQRNDATPSAPLSPRALVVAEPRTNSLIVRAGPRDLAEVRALVTELDRPGGDAVNEIRVFRLRNTLASELAPVLQRALRGAGTGDNATRDAAGAASLLRLVTVDPQGKQILESGVLAGATINADTRANSLIVSAPPESMPLMAALIELLDVPPDAVAELKVFTIQNGDAVALAEMLRGLFGAPEQAGAGAAAGAQSAGNRLFQLRFSVDERTNSIIAAGSSDELLVVEAVLLRLDASDSRQRINRVYKLKNADAEQVALALQEWLQQKREVEATAPGVVSPFQQIEREVVIVAEINSNSLIVSATPTYYEELSEIIRQVDEEAPIVMIQVLIGEVRLGDIDEFGVELGLQDSLLFDRSLLENIQNITTTTQTQSAGGAVTNVTQQQVQAATLTPGFNFGDANQPLGNAGSDRSLATASKAAAQGIASFGVGRVSQAAGFGGLVLSASSDSVSMLLRALQQSQRLEVLSRPQIIALDNQTGRAFVGQIVPYITESFVDNFGQRINTVDFRDVGLELLVRPRISPEDLVVMEVFAQKSELGPVASGVPISIAPNGQAINAPIIDTISAETTVSAVSGQTVVLSGLLLKRDRELHRRVPLLADIPLLGELFKYDSKQVERSELLIVLTPHVIRSRAQSELLKQTESSRMSWCLSDVVDMQGPAGLRSRNDTLGAAEAETVYPTDIPNENGLFEPTGEHIGAPVLSPPPVPTPSGDPPPAALPAPAK